MGDECQGYFYSVGLPIPAELEELRLRLTLHVVTSGDQQQCWPNASVSHAIFKMLFEQLEIQTQFHQGEIDLHRAEKGDELDE